MNQYSANYVPPQSGQTTQLPSFNNLTKSTGATSNHDQPVNLPPASSIINDGSPKKGHSASPSVPALSPAEKPPQQVPAHQTPAVQSQDTAAQSQAQAQAQAQAIMETQQGGSNYKPLNVKDALHYLDQVKLQFREQTNVYNNFLDIMKDFKSQKYVF